jgi:hypothetical protein
VEVSNKDEQLKNDDALNVEDSSSDCAEDDIKEKFLAMHIECSKENHCDINVHRFGHSGTMNL